MEDANHAVTAAQYDPLGRPIKVARPGDALPDAPTLEWRYTPENPGLKIEILRRQDAGAVRSELTFYDGLGRLLQTRLPFESGRQAVTNVDYNPRGQKVATYAPADEPSATHFERPAGWNTRPATHYTYDALGRGLTVIGPDGATQQTAYRGREISIRDANNSLTIRAQDAFGQLVQVREYIDSPESAWPEAAAYATTQYAYDLLGNLVRVQDAAGHVTTMSYNPLGWKIGMTDPNMGAWSYTYDKMGRLLTQTDANGDTLRLVYDMLGRVTRKAASPSNEAVETTLATMSYDDAGTFGIGRRRSLQDSSGSHVWAYDARGRVTAESQTIEGVGSYVTGYVYNAADQLVRIHYPIGETVDMSYDNQRLPYTLASDVAGLPVQSAAYNARGQMLSMLMGNGTRSTYAYDDVDSTPSLRLQVAGLSQSVGGQALLYQAYTYDRVGNLTHLIDGRFGLPEEAFTFAYDALNRLTGVSGALNETYAYDPVGNLLQLGDRTYQYDDPAHPQAVTGTSHVSRQANTYQYDANGNMTVRAEWIDSRLARFNQEWTVENQLSRVIDQGNGATWTQRYDGDGRRVGQVGPDGLAAGYFAGGLVEDQAIYTEDLSDGSAQGWEVKEGVWEVQNGEFVGQSEPGGDARTVLEQPLTGSTTLVWTMRFEAGTTGGLNFFSATLERENSYLLRQDAGQVRLFRAREGTVEQLAAFPAANATGQTHRYQVTVEPALRRLTIWRDGALLGTTTDLQPLGGGAYLFLVADDATIGFDDIRAGQLNIY